MSSGTWEFRESAQHPHHEHFKALCHPTQLSVLDAGCDLCKEPTVGMERMSVSQAADWAALLKTGIQLNKSLCLPVHRLGSTREMDDLPSKSWFCWLIVQLENEAHFKSIRCFKEQEKAIWPHRDAFFFSLS